MEPFPGFLLESRVIIDKAQVTNALSSFIDDKLVTQTLLINVHIKRVPATLIYLFQLQIQHSKYLKTEDWLTPCDPVWKPEKRKLEQ